MSVACEASGPGETTAWITYRLTALSPAGEAALDTFTREFPSMLASWQESINGKIVGAGFSWPMS